MTVLVFFEIYSLKNSEFFKILILLCKIIETRLHFFLYATTRPEIESDENGDFMLEMPDESHVDWIINLGNWPVINKPHAGHLQFTKSEIEDVIVEHYVNNPGNTALINIEKDADLGVLKLLQCVQKFVAGSEIWSFLDIFRIIFGQKVEF